MPVEAQGALTQSWVAGLGCRMGEAHATRGPPSASALEQIRLSVVRLARVAEFGGAPGTFHGQHQNQKGLVQMAVVQLRSFSQALGDEVVSDLELVENRRL